VSPEERAGSAADFLPASRRLGTLRRAAAGCRGCELWRDATETVFGDGPQNAALMLVGEQPGDREDREWRPKGKRRIHQRPRTGEAES
jgi:DNA polymerase